MNKYRLILKNNGIHVHSIIFDSDSSPCAQDIFELFKNDKTNKHIPLLNGTFEENMNKFTFEAYKLPENYGN